MPRNKLKIYRNDFHTYLDDSKKKDSEIERNAPKNDR